MTGLSGGAELTGHTTISPPAAAGFGVSMGRRGSGRRDPALRFGRGSTECGWGISFRDPRASDCASSEVAEVRLSSFQKSFRPSSSRHTGGDAGRRQGQGASSPRAPRCPPAADGVRVGCGSQTQILAGFRAPPPPPTLSTTGCRHSGCAAEEENL